VLPVRHALQGHAESPALWERHINKVLITDLAFTTTTHERNIYRGVAEDHLVHICCQVDDLAIACKSISVAQQLIKRIGQGTPSAPLALI
jgi:hypothetical protein